jgi:hypothetical protein
MGWQSLMANLRNAFQNKNDLEEFIISKNPKTAADVEHWLQQWTYSNHKDYLGM